MFILVKCKWQRGMKTGSKIREGRRQTGKNTWRKRRGEIRKNEKEYKSTRKAERYGKNKQGDQKVSVHLIITVQIHAKILYFKQFQSLTMKT
jgi:hypothetical protein